MSPRFLPPPGGGRAFFDQIVQAESYAGLIGRSEKPPETMLPWAAEEPWMTRSAILPRRSELPETEPLPTLLGSSPRREGAPEKERIEGFGPSFWMMFMGFQHFQLF